MEYHTGNPEWEQGPLPQRRRHRPRSHTTQSVLDLEDFASYPEDSFMKRVLDLNGTGDGVDMQHLRSLSRIHPSAPFQVVPLRALKEVGRIPRSDEAVTRLASDMPPGTKVAFLSHRWIRPWSTREETEQNGHHWAGAPHPDDEKNTKFRLLVDGMEYVAAERQWGEEELAVWIDYACIDQDDVELRQAGVGSLLGYMSRCKFVIIPSTVKPKYNTVHRMPGDYGKRAWTRLEALGFYVLSLLGNLTRPELYYSSPAGEVGRVDYVLLPYTLPSTGFLHNEDDRDIISLHERVCLDVLHSSAVHGSQAAAGPGMVAAAGLGLLPRLEELLNIGVSVNATDNSGISALWSASRRGHKDSVKWLLERRANVDLAPDSGLAPLHCAALEGHTEVLRMLLANGATADMQDKEGQTPLVWATLKGHVGCVVELLKGGASELAAALSAAKELEKLGQLKSLEVLDAIRQATLDETSHNQVAHKHSDVSSPRADSGSLEWPMTPQQRTSVEAAVRRARLSTRLEDG